MQDPRQPPEAAAATSNAALTPGANNGTSQEEQLPYANPLTAQALQQLEQHQGFVPVAASTGQPAAVQPYFEHTEAPRGTLQQPVHRSPLGPTSLARKDSIASTCSSTALLGCMSGVSMHRIDNSSVSSQQQLQARLHAEQQVALQAQAATAAAAAAGPSTAQLLQQAAVGGSTSSSPPVSPSRHGVSRFSADGSSVGAGAMAIPVPPTALGLPAIATTLPGSLAGTSPTVNSPRGGMCSPHLSVRSLGITPQASALPNAALLATAAAAHAQQQQQQLQQQQWAASVAGAVDTGDSDYDSSSDDDDNYEFGEQKIKRTFSRQQRRQRRQQQVLVQQQQQQQAAAAAAAQQQQQQQQQQQMMAQMQMLQQAELLQQLQQADIQVQLQQLQQQQAARNPQSPSAQGGSPTSELGAVEPSPAAAGTGSVSADVATSALSAAVLGSSPPSAPFEMPGAGTGGSAQGSNSGAGAPSAAAAAAAAAIQQQQQQQVTDQQALLAMLTAQQQQQQQQVQPGLVAPVTGATSAEGVLLQVQPSVEWASAVPEAAAASRGAGGLPAAAASGSEPSFMRVLEHTLSGGSAVSTGKVAGTSPVFGSIGSAGGVVPSAAAAAVAAAAAGGGVWLKGRPSAGAADVAGSVGSARGVHLVGGSSGEVQRGASFMTRQQTMAAGLGSAGLDAAAAAAAAGALGGGVGSVPVAGGGGAGGSVGGAAGAAAAAAAGVGEGGKKEQSVLKAEFQGLSLFNEEDDDDDGEGDKEERPRWYKRPLVWGRIAALCISGLLLLVGVLSQNVNAISKVNNAGVDLFRWMYFFAAWPALWMTVNFFTNKLFSFIEWWFYREALFYLDSVRRTARGLIFMCLILPWFVLCFWQMWCSDNECEAIGTYKKATDVIWKVLVCLTLFSLANFLKSVLTKLLSSHFYKTAHFMKVKAAIEKEYWLLMLSQPRPAPKAAEPPLARLSHFMYTGNGAGLEGDPADGPGVVVEPRSHSESTGLGSTLRRRNKLSKATDGLSKTSLLTTSVNFLSRKETSKARAPQRAVSCGTFGTEPHPAGAPSQAHREGTNHAELTLSSSMAAQMASFAVQGPAAGRQAGSGASGGSVGSGEAHGGTLSPDMTARIVMSAFNLEQGEATRSSAQLEERATPSPFAAPGVAPAGSAGSFAARAVGGLPVGPIPGAAPSHLLGAVSADRARSSSLRWTQEDAAATADAVAARAASAVAAGAGAAGGAEPEVNLRPFQGDASRTGVFSGSDAEADGSGGGQGPRWAFWKRAGSTRTGQQQQLLPDGHSPSSPPSQHTLFIQDSVKPLAGSSPSKVLGSPLGSVFGSPTAQQQQQQQRTGLSRVNSQLSRKPTFVSVPRRSTDAAGVAGSVAGGGTRAAPAAPAAPAAGSAAAVTADPLLAPGVLEAVNLRVDGKAVDTATIKPAEWERLRTGIALKTFTALMKRYQNLTDTEEAKKLRDARRFAKGLFYHVRSEVRPYVIRDDFMPFFGSKDSADAAFAYFDKDNDATISLKEMKDSVAAIFKERKNMAASLKDTDSIVNTLEFGIGFLLHFIFAAIYLLVWGMDIVKGFSTFSATVLALTFVFGNSVRQIFESMLFLFVEHAFDVGDLLEVELIAYRVKKIDLMYTVLVKSTGERCYFPNTRLITLPVVNLTRSCARSEKVVISLNVGQASNAAREALLAAVKEHYEENESDFNSCPSVNFVNLVDPFKVQMSVTWTYNFGADETKRTSTVKTALLQAIHSCLGSLTCLEYTLVKGAAAGEDDGSDRPSKPRDPAAGGMGAGVAEVQAANMATMGAAALGVGMLGGTAMMGTAGLAML